MFPNFPRLSSYIYIPLEGFVKARVAWLIPTKRLCRNQFLNLPLIDFDNTKSTFCRNQSSRPGRPWQSPQGRKFGVKSVQYKTCLDSLSLKSRHQNTYVRETTLHYALNRWAKLCSSKQNEMPLNKTMTASLRVTEIRYMSAFSIVQVRQLSG